jgi:hypothetical protein
MATAFPNFRKVQIKLAMILGWITLCVYVIVLLFIDPAYLYAPYISPGTLLAQVIY